jgi:integrase/recombinase XerD
MEKTTQGKAAYLSRTEAAKIRSFLTLESHKLLWDIARYTGERWGAIIQLKITDVWSDPKRGYLRDKIIFPRETRKHSAGKIPEPREVEIHTELHRTLSAYKPGDHGWLFPSPPDPMKHITLRSCDKFLRRAVKLADLSKKKISTHSTRRSFITDLARNGVDRRIIKELTGHKSYEVLDQYIVSDPQDRRRALATLH